VDLTGLYPHDVAHARALLKAAGYGAGLTLSLKLPPPSYARRAGEIIAAQLAAAGVTARIENLEWAQWLDQVYARHDFDLSIVGHAEPLDFDIYGRDDYYFGYVDAGFKSLLTALDDTLDVARRRELLGQIQRKIATDAVNGFLFQYPGLAVWNAHLAGISTGNVLGYVDLRSLHFTDPAFAAASVPKAGAAAASGSVRYTLALVCLALGAALVAVAARFGSVYLLKRLAVLVATLLVASAAVFVAVQVVPGDPVQYMMGLAADAHSVATLRHELGLDQAPLARYLHWLGGLLHGDFGLSYTYRIPIGMLIAERLQVSVPLALYALALTVLIAFPVGLWAAARRGRFVDGALGALTQLGLALPNFWLGMLLVLLFALSLHWVSAGGFPGWDAGMGAALKALTLPAIALSMPQAAILARVLRAALIEALDQDYIRTARAKGAGEWRVLWRHALPNALLPVMTILGMQFSFLLAGGVIIENVFFLPGLGRLVFQAIVQRDLLVVQDVVMLLVLAVVTVTCIIDLLYVIVNPRLAVHGR
jgi:peptide/nickel transport system substrate-binding protein